MASRTRENVSYHEAGHAVIAELLGCTVKQVKIYERLRSAGESSWSGSVETDATSVKNKMMIAMAGPIAEAMFLVWKDQSLEIKLEVPQWETIYAGFSCIRVYRTDGIKIPFHSLAKRRTWFSGRSEIDDSRTQVFVTGWTEDWEVVRLAGGTKVDFEEVVTVVQANWSVISRIASDIQRGAQVVAGMTEQFPVLYESIV